MCLCTKQESNTLTIDQPAKYRNRSNYSAALNIIENSSVIDVKQTKGVTEYCILNDLGCFHMLDNWTADIMHDLCEGTIKYLLLAFLEFGIDRKVFTEHEINGLIQNYDYGVLNRKSIPSELKLKKKNLNQNASQMKCLMSHIPFIFNSYKNTKNLENVWICINTMLKILRIVYSNSITEQDLTELNDLVDTHLKHFQDCFGINLKPKHHYMIHYSEIIRRSGPLCFMSSLRYEMKHKSLTDTMKNNNNFKNVTKSITQKFLQKSVFKDIYIDHIDHSKLRVPDHNFLQRFESFHTNFNRSSSIHSVKNLNINSDYYTKGLILFHNLKYFEIEEILFIDEEYHFLCSKFDRIEFNNFLCSVEINKSNIDEYILIKYLDLVCTKTYEIKIVGNKTFIQSDSLTIK